MKKTVLLLGETLTGVKCSACGREQTMLYGELTICDCRLVRDQKYKPPAKIPPLSKDKVAELEPKEPTLLGKAFLVVLAICMWPFILFFGALALLFTAYEKKAGAKKAEQLSSSVVSIIVVLSFIIIAMGVIGGMMDGNRHYDPTYDMR